jgi:hypothetical protein
VHEVAQHLDSDLFRRRRESFQNGVGDGFRIDDVVLGQNGDQKGAQGIPYSASDGESGYSCWSKSKSTLDEAAGVTGLDAARSSPDCRDTDGRSRRAAACD